MCECVCVCVCLCVCVRTIINSWPFQKNVWVLQKEIKVIVHCIRAEEKVKETITSTITA